MKHCIINFGKGAWYPRGQARLVSSLKDVNYGGSVFAWTDESQINSPQHAVSPYAFKLAAFNEAAKAGFDTILWCDSAVWAWHDVMPLFEYIDVNGHVFFEGGWNCAQWTSDACLKQLNVTRDEAEKMPQYMACCMGLSLKSERSRTFLSELTACSTDGVSFPGAWNNALKQCSEDSRCLGHRHDQAAGSILAHRHGMGLIVGHESFFQYYANQNGTAFRYGEQNDMSLMNPNVSLLSQGM